MNNETVHIIGGGIGGLTLALGLLRNNVPVRVYEQAPALGEVGAGLSISPNASKGLGYLDMLGFMDAQSNIPEKNYVFHGETNEELVAIDRTTDRDRFGGLYYQIHRADFHGELARCIEVLSSDCIQLGKKLSGITQTDQGVSLSFEGGETIKAKTVIGADGIRSVVRDHIFRDCEPEFTNLMAWRGLIDPSKVPSQFLDPVSRVWTGAGKTFVTYPIRHDGLVNVVAFSQASGWVEEGWSVPAKRRELVDAFSGWCAPVQALIKAVPEDNLFRWGLFARRPLERLVKGNVALIGDAAHPMLPWFGQGASSSIEDGVVLARCFEASENTAQALERYNKARFERVCFLQTNSNAGTSRMQSMDPYSLRDAPRQDEDALGIFKYDPASAEV